MKKIHLLLLGVFMAVASCGAPPQERLDEAAEAVETIAGNQIAVGRSTGFAGSLVPYEIFLDGVSLGTVGVNKVGKFAIPAGQFELTAQIVGIGAVGMQPARIDITKVDGVPLYFNLSQRSGLLGSSLILTPTLPAGVLR